MASPRMSPRCPPARLVRPSTLERQPHSLGLRSPAAMHALLRCLSHGLRAQTTATVAEMTMVVLRSARLAAVLTVLALVAGRAGASASPSTPPLPRLVGQTLIGGMHGRVPDASLLARV